MTCVKGFYFFIFLVFPFFISAQNGWTDSFKSKANLQSVEHKTLPSQFRLLELDLQLLKNAIKTNTGGQTCIDIPMPDGSEECFILEAYNIIPKSLSNKHPDLKTYRGRSLYNPKSRIYFMQTANDLHIIGDSDEGTFFIDKVKQGIKDLYISFFAKHEVQSPLQCEAYENPEKGTEKPEELNKSMVTPFSWGTELKKYRMAILWTPEHVASYGNDTLAIIARDLEIVTDMNFVCERDMCVTFELAVNPEYLIFPDENNNPYTGLSSATGAMNDAIGAENFEIGTVISGSGGGVSYVGVTCGGARGGSQCSNSHWVIVHELGHNMGAGHMMNYCPGWGGNNMEPGAGNSIMSYGGTGVCGGGHQVPGGRIDYFHSRSIEQMYNTLFVNTSCAETILTNNNIPTVTVPTSGFYIPKSTPFKLLGSATDPDANTNFTYSWQQFDSGIGSPPWAPTDADPLFQMLPPSTSSERILPKLESLINGFNYGEVLSDVARTLNFRFLCLG